MTRGVRRCRKAGRRGIAVRSTPCRSRDLGTLGLVLREGAGGRPGVIGELDVCGRVTYLLR